jgi:hypothetical protein
MEKIFNWILVIVEQRKIFKMENAKPQSTKCYIFETYFVIIGVFNLREIILESTHAFSHACLPLLDFFDHVMHFWVFNWINCIDA